MARASRRCRLGGTSWSAVVITTAVGTSTSAIHSCEVNSTADCTADMAAGRLVLDSCARAHARDSPSWTRRRGVESPSKSSTTAKSRRSPDPCRSATTPCSASRWDRARPPATSRRRATSRRGSTSWRSRPSTISLVVRRTNGRATSGAACSTSRNKRSAVWSRSAGIVVPDRYAVARAAQRSAGAHGAGRPAGGSHLPHDWRVSRLRRRALRAVLSAEARAGARPRDDGQRRRPDARTRATVLDVGFPAIWPSSDVPYAGREEQATRPGHRRGQLAGSQVEARSELRPAAALVCTNPYDERSITSRSLLESARRRPKATLPLGGFPTIRAAARQGRAGRADLLAAPGRRSDHRRMGAETAAPESLARHQHRRHAGQQSRTAGGALGRTQNCCQCIGFDLDATTATGSRA